MKIKQSHAYYSGSVQGVGFRYTAERLSRTYGIKGWVRNTYDGKVEVVAQGKATNVDLYIEALRKEFPVRQVAQAEEPIEGFSGFEVRY